LKAHVEMLDREQGSRAGLPRSWRAVLLGRRHAATS
jgi:hypothetical protein